MKFLKKLLVTVLVLFALFLLAGLFFPMELKVKKSRTIKAPKAVVKERLVNLKHFNEWSPWAENDSGTEYSYEGSMGEVGSTMKWDSDNENMGKGSYTLKRISGDSIFMELVFLKPHKSKSSSYYVLEEADTGVKVTWGFEQPLSYPSHMIPHLMGVKEMLGKQYAKGLKELSKTINDGGRTSMPIAKIHGYSIREARFPAKSFYIKKDTLPFDSIKAFYETHFEAIGKAMGEAGIRPSGPPTGIYEEWNA